MNSFERVLEKCILHILIVFTHFQSYKKLKS